MGPYLQFLSNLPQAWILGISPGIFLLVVIKWSPTHLKILDSNEMTQLSEFQQLEITNFPIRSHLSTNEKHWTQRSGKPRFAILLRKKPSLFFQEKRTDGTDVSMYIYIHTFIYSLFAQQIVYTYTCICQSPVWNLKPDWNFAVQFSPRNNLSNSQWLATESSTQLADGNCIVPPMQRYAPTQGLEAAESRLLLCQMAGTQNPPRIWKVERHDCGQHARGKAALFWSSFQTHRTARYRFWEFPDMRYQ